MVEEICARLGLAPDSPVAAAMRRVPRDRFLDDLLLGGTIDLDVIHQIDRAVPVPGFDPEQLTTSVSAPGLVGWMLRELHLVPGMRVLEIGAGRGYNAALLAELGCDVTTIDIDATLIEPTRLRLAALGYERVAVRHGDGDAGVPDCAPFDRIVATVGCNDLAPAWFEQLAPAGFMVVPVRHGESHPVVKATPDHRSRFLGHSGFVAVLGVQQAEVAADVDLGADLRSWRSEWVPRGSGAGAWVIPRVHHDQVMLA
jgi:protein-L-isoaspartate(D-aspartate) O-methyltransferase